MKASVDAQWERYGRALISSMSEVLDEGAHLELAGVVVERAQERGRVNRRQHQRQAGPLDELPTLQGDPKVAAEQRLGRGSSQQNEVLWLDRGDLGIERWPAGIDLGGVGLLMQPALALRLPLEVLDGVRDIHLAPVDSRRLECVIEHAAGGSDEGLAFPIFAIAGLLAHEHHPRVLGAFAEDGLGGALIEVAGAAARGCRAQTV